MQQGTLGASHRSLCSLIPSRAYKLSSSLSLNHCFWTAMGTEGIPKGLEIPARFISSIGSWVPMAPGNLGSCAASLKKMELSPAQQKVEKGSRKLQMWEYLPSSSFHSCSLLAIFSPQDSSSVCPLPPCIVWMC